MSEVALVSGEMLDRWRGLLAQSHTAAEDYYFEQILPNLLEGLQAIPAHRALRDQRYHTLISLMGFSPETTVISAAILRPESLVVVLSESAEGSFDRAHDFLTARKILRPSQIERLTISPVDPRAIYAEIQRALRRRADRKETARSHIFDVTGGKKIMSATAGQVAWEADWPLCYVESGAYDPALRRPRPGREELIVLPSPSQQHGRRARRTALATYHTRNYVLAAAAFEQSRQSRAEDRLDCLGLALCRCYAAWADLDLPQLDQQLQSWRKLIAELRMIDLFRGQGVDPSRYERHVQALAAVARGDRLALIATFLELAALYRSGQRHDFSSLLAYRALEALVEYGLQRVAGEGFNRDKPDYSLLGDRDDLERRFAALSESSGGRRQQRLPDKVALVEGLVLLCLVDQVHTRFERPLSEGSLIQRIRAEAHRRNGSVLAHGHRTLTASDSESIAQRTEELAQAILHSGGYQQLLALRTDLAPLPLDDLDAPEG